MADAAPMGKELSLLCKLLKMTTSANDGEALVAMRKANEQLTKSFGGDWEALLFSKVTIIADPFVNLADPTKSKAPRHEPPPPPPRASPPPPPHHAQSPRPAWTRTYAAPPVLTPWQHRTPPFSTPPYNRTMISNSNEVHCQHCMNVVDAGRGLAVKYTTGGPWIFFCDQTCELDWFTQYAPKPTPKPKPKPNPTRTARTNAFSGNCLHCGNHVAAQAGFILPRDPKGWDLVCSIACKPTASQPKAPAGSIDDL